MNRYAIQHIADSSYCFPVSEHEIVLRLRTAKDDIKTASVIYESKYVIGERQQKKELTKSYTGGLFDYFTIKLDLKDTRLGYVFYVNDGESNYYFSEDGITDTYDFTKGFYNFFQYPYINKVDIMEGVEWMKKAVYYQIFVDRFYQGDLKKDLSYINCEWGQIPKPKTFAGGDLKGIIEKLGYIKALGANTIYLTPVFESVSNHKYDISNYKKVDEHFGSSEDLNELIEQAHAMDMRIVLDAVFNHCSENLMEFQDVVEKGRDSKYYNWFIIHGDRPEKSKQNYETFASCDYMPKFNTSNDEVQKFLIDIACYYINEFHIDGWRLDVSDEVSHDFWRNFRKAVKKADRDVVIIGENWHDAYSNLRGDQYDSIMNYAFTKGCLDYFATGAMDAKQFAYKLNDILMRNSDTVNNMMLNLLDSHDTHRFFSEVGENKEKMLAALSILYLFPGAPCIFYGTEILTPGGYDPDCRRCMDWEKANDSQNDVAMYLKKLSEIRQQTCLADGTTQVYSEHDVFILKIQTEDKQVELYINNTQNTATVDNREIGEFSHCIYLNGSIYVGSDRYLKSC